MYKRQILTDPNEPIRLNKFLANAGVCSRREADEFITAGVVSVNGVIVTELYAFERELSDYISSRTLITVKLTLRSYEKSVIYWK